MEEKTEQTIGVDPRLVGALMLHVAGLEKALRAYYDQHQKDGCGGCELCKEAERAWSSMARAR